MKIKLLVLMFLVTALALVSRQPAWAIGLCPAYSCVAFNNACVYNGGNPTLPVNIGETCYTLPGHTVYDIAIGSCQYPGSETFQECYW